MTAAYFNLSRDSRADNGPIWWLVMSADHDNVGHRCRPSIAGFTGRKNWKTSAVRRHIKYSLSASTINYVYHSCRRVAIMASWQHLDINAEKLKRTKTEKKTKVHCRKAMKN